MVGWLAVDSLAVDSQLQKYPLNQNCHNIVTNSHWSHNHNNLILWPLEWFSPLPHPFKCSIPHLNLAITSGSWKDIQHQSVLERRSANDPQRPCTSCAPYAMAPELLAKWLLPTFPTRWAQLPVISRVVITPLMGVKNPSYPFLEAIYRGHITPFKTVYIYIQYRPVLQDRGKSPPWW